MNERDSETAQKLQVGIDKWRNAKRDTLTYINKSSEINKACLECEKRLINVRFPTLLCWHLVLEKRSPLTTQTVIIAQSLTLTTYLTPGTVTRTDRLRSHSHAIIL